MSVSKESMKSNLTFITLNLQNQQQMASQDKNVPDEQAGPPYLAEQ